MKKATAICLSVLLLASCVPQRKYQDLETRYREIEEKNKSCREELEAAKADSKEARENLISIESVVSRLRTDSIETHSLFESNKKLYTELKDSYEKLLKNNKVDEERMVNTLKELEQKLQQKEIDLAAKEANLNENVKKNAVLKEDLDKMKNDLLAQQQHIYELQNILNAKDSAVKSLKNKLSSALLGFADKGLSVDIKNGKVYVSMDEKLLFASASTVVDSKGKEALLELARSIKGMKDIHIMVEGHTDDVPMSSATIKDNWDLSVLRATSIVRILTKEGQVDPHIFAAVGRGEFYPVDPAKTKDARAKNRRTEIIISPNLDEIFQLLDQPDK
jgi:chemotaxis protein MotB